MSQYDKLKELALAATALNLDTADQVHDISDMHFDCPLCDGEGFVSGDVEYSNIDGVALSVQFYGIGDEYCSAEEYFREANPTTILALIAQRDELLAAMLRYLPFIPSSAAKDGGAASHSENVKAADQFREAIAKAVQP